MLGKGLFELDVYKMSLELSEKSWEIYQKIPKYLRYTFGNQFLEAIDSIGANIAEGFGRYHYKDSLKFYYNSRGSIWESRFWLELLKQRQLITENQFKDFEGLITRLAVKLNNFIHSIKTILKEEELK